MPDTPDAVPELKPGWKSSEVQSAIAAVLGLLTTLGVISTHEAASYTTAITQAILGVTAVVGAVALVWKTATERSALKAAQLQLHADFALRGHAPALAQPSAAGDADAPAGPALHDPSVN